MLNEIPYKMCSLVALEMSPAAIKYLQLICDSLVFHKWVDVYCVCKAWVTWHLQHSGQLKFDQQEEDQWASDKDEKTHNKLNTERLIN